MSPLRGVGGRLALALLVVVTGVLVIVYLIVVPSYRSSLENNELRGLEQSLRSEIPNFPAEPYLADQFAQETAPKVDARVLVYQPLDPTQPSVLVSVGDSAAESNSTDAENDQVAFDAISRSTLARGTVQRGGQTYAEVAYPVGTSVILFSASLHDQLQAVSVVRTRVFVAGGIAMVFAVFLGYAGASLFTRRIKHHRIIM